MEILQQLYPVEVWKPLDWTTAESFELAFANWQGCPTNLDSGIHFMGQGKAKISLYYCYKENFVILLDIEIQR